MVYDLGRGDGRIVIAAAKIYPTLQSADDPSVYGAHGVGIDIDPRRILESKSNAKKAGVESLVRFEENDSYGDVLLSQGYITYHNQNVRL